MHLRKTAVLAVLCVGLTSLGAFCESKDVPNQTPAALTALVKVRPGLKVEPRAVQGLVERILSDNAALAGDFGKKDFIAVAKRLGERGASIVTPKYDKLWGKHSAEFWQLSWKDGAVFEVVTVGIMISDVIGTRTVEKCLPDEGKVTSVTYNLAATVIQEIHVKEGPPAAHNATSLAGLIYRHQDTCVWE